MEIKVLNSIYGNRYPHYDCFFIGTHGGIFHSDEVVACAILCLLRNERRIWILRTRDEEMLKMCDICVDVGGGNFDHHLPGFNKTHKTGVPYASAGLVWESFGKSLVSKIINMNSSFSMAIDFVQDIVDRVYDEIISLVDCEDNGIKAEKHCFNFIPSFLPIWSENSSTYELQFYQVLNITMQILTQELKRIIDAVISENITQMLWKSEKFSNNILEIPSQTFPWLDSVTKINSSIPFPFLNDDLIKFVIFPYPAGGWAAQCVPPSLEKKFEQLVPFPKEWAGQSGKDLAEISFIDDADFCHNQCFFVRAKSREGVIKMCKIAMS